MTFNKKKTYGFGILIPGNLFYVSKNDKISHNK